MSNYSFWKWLELKEAVHTHLGFMPPGEEDDAFSYRTPEAEPKFTGPKLGVKDPVGIPTLQQPGLRASDKKKILEDFPKVEEKLEDITRKLGLHFVVSYIEPDPETPQVNSTPENPLNMRQTYEKGKAGWDMYHAMSSKKGEDLLRQFMQQHANESPTPSPENTIVYIKPTSRADPLDAWQQAHNIGHALWGYAKRTTGEKLKGVFIKAMRDIMYRLQQKYSPHAESPEPTAQEMTLLACRLFNIESCRKIFQSEVPDEKNKGNYSLTNPKWKTRSMFNSFDEFMFEMVALYIHNHGTFLPNPDIGKSQRPLEPYNLPAHGQKGLRDPANHDQMWATGQTRGKMEPNKEVERWIGLKQDRTLPGGAKPGAAPIRSFAWDEMPVGAAEWHEAYKTLEAIMEEAWRACTWARVGGPIYATHGYVTTGA